MKTVLVLLCLVALASSQLVIRPSTLRQICRPDDMKCNLDPPGGPRSMQLNTANIGNLVASIVQQIVDYIFPDAASLRHALPTLQDIERLVTWVVGEVENLINGVETLRRRQDGNNPHGHYCHPRDKLCNIMHPVYLPLFPRVTV
uniref:Uncharacterized protein n=1 Tax=Anopheles minimus TaxID=112268 RepID=A0A182VUP2_9DIPT